MARRSARLLGLLVIGASALTASGATADECLPATKPSGDSAARLFARAKAAYEGRRFEEAARAFREIAFEHPGDGAAISATQLYLDSLDRLGTMEHGLACFAAMAADVPSLHALYCDGPAKLAANDEACRRLEAIQLDVERLRAQRTIEAAEKSTSVAKAEALFEQGAAMYLGTFAAFCERPAAKGAIPRASRCDELVYNAARAFAAAHDIPRSIAAFESLVVFDERAKLGSPLVPKALYAIGGSHQAIASYEEAATWYERLADLYPKESNAKTALSDAAILRLGTGQEESATRDVQLFVRSYSASSADDALALVLTLAEHHVQRSDWDKARAILEGSGPSQRSSIDLRVRYLALAARVHAKGSAEDRRAAAREYASVLALWSGPAAERAIQTSDGGDPYRLARALMAVGEASFEVAETRRLEQVASLKPPAYGGPRDGASVTRHVQTTLRDWVEKKRAAIASVESAYGKLVELRPYPPPGSVVAAAHRVAIMWAELVDDLRRAPSPAGGKRDPLFKGYQVALDALVSPILTGKAKPALSKCIAMSTKLQYRVAGTRECEAWMAKNFEGEAHPIDEIVPALVSRSRGEPSVNPASPLGEDGKHRRL